MEEEQPAGGGGAMRDPLGGPYFSCGRAWRAARGGVGEGGGASRRGRPAAHASGPAAAASGGAGLQASRGRGEAGGGQAEAARPGRRALPQPRTVDSLSRRQLGGGLDRRRRCAATPWTRGHGLEGVEAARWQGAAPAGSTTGELV